MRSKNYAKYYMRIISVFFLLIIITLITDLIKNGFTYETLHKVIHISIGTYGILFLWNITEKKYKDLLYLMAYSLLL